MLFLFLCVALTESVQSHQTEFKGGPENITLTWQNDSMVIQTSRVQYKQDMSQFCFQLVLQRKSSKEMEWQGNIVLESYEMDSSSWHWSCFNPNLDPEKCFHIRLQFQTLDFCISNVSESVWSNNIFMKNYSLVESCDEQKPAKLEVRGFIILFSAISTLTIFVIVFFRCNMERMKKSIFPIVPDPKNSFHNIFDGHNGYFQEWEKTASNDAHQEVVECVMDEQNDERASTYVKENEVVMPVNKPLIEEQEDSVTSGSPQKESCNVCIGNMNFTMNESMYVML
ncbi:hypothetical protein PRIEUP_LOCUS1668 [Pristimantis euphronides]